MKVLDRYLTRELLVPLVLSVLILVTLLLIADLFDNLDDLLRNDTPQAVIMKYYLSLVPFCLIQILPWATWLGTLFLFVNLGFHNETTAMKVAGLKITSIIRPVIFLGFLMGIIYFLVSDRILPDTYRTATELRETYIEVKKETVAEKTIQNVTYYADTNRLYYFRTFTPAQESVGNAIILWFDEEKHSTRQKMIANSGKWKSSVWEFEGVTEYQMDSSGRVLGEPHYYPVKTYQEINVSPQDLLAATSDTNFLSYRELKRLIGQLKDNGVGIYAEKVDLHYRLAAPWQGLVMMLTIVPFLARTATRKIIAMNVLICVGLVFAFHVAGAVGIALGKAGKIIPFLSAWSANILFAGFALLNLEKGNY